MREFKKYFFESIIQLTILANVFKQYNRFNQLDEPMFNSFHDAIAAGDLNMLMRTENFNQNNRSSNNGSLESDTFLNYNYRVKETQSYMNELKLIDRLNRLTSSASLSNPNLILFPASYIDNSNNNPKELNDLSETRILLNSIELNPNNHTLRKVS
jgi:hypothetical protein